MPVFIFTHTSCTHIIYLDFISISVHIDTWDFILSLSLFVFVYLIDIRYPVGNSISDCRWPGAFCRRDLSADQSQWSIPPEMRDRGRAEADWGTHGRWGPRRWSWGGCSHETDHTKTCRQETDPATGFASHLVSGFGKSQEPGCSNEQPLEVAVFLASRGWWCRLGSASKCIGHKGCGQEARPEVAQQADVSHMPAGSANENPSSSTIQAVSLDVTQWISEEEAGTNSSIIHRRGQGWHRLCQREGPMACMLGGLRVQTLFWQIRRRPTDFFAAPKGQSPFSPCGACLSLALVLVFFWLFSCLTKSVLFWIFGALARCSAWWRRPLCVQSHAGFLMRSGSVRVVGLEVGRLIADWCGPDQVPTDWGVRGWYIHGSRLISHRALWINLQVAG